VASWRRVRVSESARLARVDRRVNYVEFRSFDRLAGESQRAFCKAWEYYSVAPSEEVHDTPARW